MKDWYENRHKLEAGMIFEDIHGDYVQLETRVPGDGTQWIVSDYIDRKWSHEGSTVEPSDLVKLMPDNWGERSF